MAENVYEGLYIFDSNRYARDAAKVSGKVDQLVQDAGGEVLVSRLWEERRLAYPINGNRKGTYWLTYFKIDSEKLTGLNRKCQISDDILRHLYLKVDPRIVDALVSHASGTAAEEDKASDKASDEAPAEPEKTEKETETVAAVADSDSTETSSEGES